MEKDRSDNDEPGGGLPPELLAQLRAAAALPDDEINTDDLPEVTDWSGAVRGLFHRPVEQPPTLSVVHGEDRFPNAMGPRHGR